METRSAQLSKETAQEMIASGIESLRQIAVSTYPELDTYESITSWKHVLQKLGLKQEPTHSAERLELIFEAIRGTTQVEFDGNTRWYCVWWNMRTNSFSISSYLTSYSDVSARLFVQDNDRINHIVKHFEQDLKKYFIR